MLDIGVCFDFCTYLVKSDYSKEDLYILFIFLQCWHLLHWFSPAGVNFGYQRQCWYCNLVLYG